LGFFFGHKREFGFPPFQMKRILYNWVAFLAREFGSPPFQMERILSI